MRRPLLFGCVCLFILVALWVQITAPPPYEAENADRAGERVSIIGQVYQKEYRSKYGEETVLLYLQSVVDSKEVETSSEKSSNFKHFKQINSMDKIICEIAVKDSDLSRQVPSLGSYVLIEGVPEKFSHATNEGEFDWADYYGIQGIGTKLEEAFVKGKSESYWPLQESLFRLREYFLRNLYRAFPETIAPLLSKMLLGVGNGLDPEIRELYQNNGIIHILSISGLHITMLGMGFYMLLRKLTLPIVPSAVLGGTVIFLYGMMTGFGVSACRAIGMYLIRMLGEIWGKSYDMLTAMGVLAIGMLLDNPRLAYHSGFLLSFSSVCGMGLLLPLLTFPAGSFKVKPGDGKLAVLIKSIGVKTMSGFSASCAVTFFTLPIQLFFFYQIPVYSVFINLLVVPFMSLVMGVGLLGMLFPMLSFLSFIETGIFGWFEWLCRGFEEFPGHTLLLGRPAIWKILLYYVVLLIPVWWQKKKGILLKSFCMGAALLIFLVRLPTGTCVYCLDVGQGDCIVVRTSDNKCFLFDGGSSSRQNVGEKVILPFLQFHGIAKLDGVYLSHGDTDHVNGVLQLIEEEVLDVGTVYLPDAKEPGLKKLEETLTKIDGLHVQRVQKGDVWQTESFRLLCLHPKRGFVGESNETSACYFFQTPELTLLLTGDVEGEGGRQLSEALQRYGINQVDVLKVSHHGSAKGTSPELLQQIHPRIALISCGRNNSYGHPHVETLNALKEAGTIVLTTPECGQITINAENGCVERKVFSEE